MTKIVIHFFKSTLYTSFKSVKMIQSFLVEIKVDEYWISRSVLRKERFITCIPILSLSRHA